jgi:hypothetical protein
LADELAELTTAAAEEEAEEAAEETAIEAPV